MKVDTSKTVGELALELPHAARVFERVGIDYCCGGRQTLEQACRNAKLQIEKVLDSLTNEERPSASALNRDWQDRSLAELIEHIVSTHHVYLRGEMPRLRDLLAKVCGVHGERHPELLSIRNVFSGLSQELSMHMMKEEQILFPHIAEMESAASSGRGMPEPMFGTVENPVRMMVAEHDSAGQALRDIREASQGFTLPEDACTSYRALYQALQELEADLHQHIHLENNLLFPRTVELERRG